MISYKPLFHLLVEKDLRKNDLKKIAGIVPSTLAKFSKGEHVSLEVIDKLCKGLGCQPGDIIEYIEKPAE